MNKLEIKGNWNVLKGKLKKQYGTLTENDLAYEEGRDDELVGQLQRALGKSREAVIDLVNSLNEPDGETIL